MNNTKLSLELKMCYSFISWICDDSNDDEPDTGDQSAGCDKQPAQHPASTLCKHGHSQANGYAKGNAQK